MIVDMFRSQYRGFVPSARIALLLSLLFLLATLACNKAVVFNQPKKSQRVTLREGDYLSTVYIDQLKKTLSPLAAGTEYGAHQFVVRKNGDLFELEPIFNFHEGGDPFTLSTDGSIVQPFPAYISHITVSVLNESSFRIGFDLSSQSFKPTDYVFVGDAASYVVGIVLTGQYKDRHGLHYEFREDGFAVFPSHKFHCEIGLDHVLTNFDYFMEMGPNHIASSLTAFKREGKDLQLFKTKEDENGFDQIVDRRPYLQLTAQR
ncbi:MAG TPA: hypothetical protein VGS27_00630 [Candidatus Sulfotelmatobacter sp.]|nr:hypothetical protein [Candidatus Sulfotelmatobacter sp.]